MKLLPAAKVFFQLLAKRERVLLRVLRRVRCRSLCDVLLALDGKGTRGKLVNVYVRGLEQPLYLRLGSTDAAVFRQVILEAQYGESELVDVKTILDAGANIGLATVFFLERFPTARVIAVEADIDNYLIAKRNIEPYGERCKLMHGAVWSERTELALRRGDFADGGEWASSTVPSDGKGNDEIVQAYSVDDLIDESGFRRIDLLKMDIEGAERNVFSASTDFLGLTQCVMVECHGDDVEQMIHSKLAGHGFDVSPSGELLIATKPGSPPE